MGRTAGFWEQDTAFPDGHTYIEASTGIITAGAGTKTRSGLGLIGVSLAASQTVTFDFDLSKLLFRYGKQDDEQQQFGSASGTGQQSLATPPGTFATNWQQSGRPPFTIATNQVVPTSRPKGVTIKNLIPIYSVSTLALTSISLGLTKTVFADVTAPVVTALLAAGTNGLSVATNAQPHATPVALAAGSQIPLVSRLSQYIAEFTLVLPATSTAFVYGLWLDLAYNYN
jgi:hypothetical protein